MLVNQCELFEAGESLRPRFSMQTRDAVADAEALSRMDVRRFQFTVPRFSLCPRVGPGV